IVDEAADQDVVAAAQQPAPSQLRDLVEERLQALPRAPRSDAKRIALRHPLDRFRRGDPGAELERDLRGLLADGDVRGELPADEADAAQTAGVRVTDGADPVLVDVGTGPCAR
ncbi:hypothetical protein LTS01_025966, partial [Friedmanniomyces endolithicus]